MKRRGIFGLGLVTTVVVSLATAAVAMAVITAVTINPQGTFSSDGQTATFTGTVTCSTLDTYGNTNYVNVSGYVEQLVHRGYAPQGYSYSPDPLQCTGSPQTYSLTVTNQSANASFQRGPAYASVYLCDYDSCISSTRSIKLVPAK